MDVEEQQGDDLDLGGGEQTPGQAEDPLAGVPAGPVEDVSGGPDAERLGGDGAGIGEEPKPGEFAEEPEEPEDANEPVPPPAPASSETASSTKAAEPAGEEPPASGKAAKPKAAKKAGKAKTPAREYKVLRIVGGQIESPLDEPVKARNGDDAIKEAYKALSESGEETMTLVAIPVGYFKEKEVKGREKKDYAVEVN